MGLLKMDFLGLTTLNLIDERAETDPVTKSVDSVLANDSAGRCEDVCARFFHRALTWASFV